MAGAVANVAAVRAVARMCGGAVTSAINALVLLARDDFPAGRWDQAEQLVNEAIQMCEQLDYPLLARSACLVHALLAAARGNEDQARELADQLLRWAVPRGIRWVQFYAWHARALAALERRRRCGRWLVVICLDRTRQNWEGAHDVTDSGSLADPRRQAAFQRDDPCGDERGAAGHHPAR
jgi:ATP/maltotriose-dependent transcriptional regulator MalT